MAKQKNIKSNRNNVSGKSINNNNKKTNDYTNFISNYRPKNGNPKLIDMRKKNKSKNDESRNVSMVVESTQIDNNLFKNPNNIDIMQIDENSAQIFIPLNGNDNLGMLLSGDIPQNNNIKMEKPEGGDTGLLDLIFKKLVSGNELEALKEKKPEEPVIEKKDERKIKFIDEKIVSIKDLIDLGKSDLSKYDESEEYRWNININAVPKIVEPLEKLETMIGLEKVKEQLFCQLMFFLQGLDNKNKDMLHTVIEGNPGVGKTELSKIIGSIYTNLGILSSDKFVIAKRGDLIGSYLGQTTLKTQKLLDECKGGVLFIDEAYSLGNEEGKDSYSKECIDAITAHLSENKQDFICIIAGYKKQLKSCFFNYNPGLERRFPWRFTIEDYSDEELMNIYLKIVNENEWNFNDTVDVEFFKKNRDYFKNNGGDMEILFHKTKLAHSLRSINLSEEERKYINLDDLKKGLEMFLNDDEVKSRNKNFEEMLQYTLYT
mgnify:CR=1 FL=1